MADDADLWHSAVGTWVALARLPETIEHALGIPRSELIPILRHPLEAGFVHAQVLDWSEEAVEMANWVWTDRIGDPERISTEGWQHVNWKDGTLGGHPIRVRWDHVRQELATLTAKVRNQHVKEWLISTAKKTTKAAAIRCSGGAPPRHDWEAFWVEVALYAAKNDLHPSHRRDLQAHMVAWAAQVSVSPPDDATIRVRLARLFKAVAGNESHADGWPPKVE